MFPCGLMTFTKKVLQPCSKRLGGAEPAEICGAPLSGIFTSAMHSGSKTASTEEIIDSFSLGFKFLTRLSSRCCSALKGAPITSSASETRCNCERRGWMGIASTAMLSSVFAPIKCLWIDVTTQKLRDRKRMHEGFSFDNLISLSQWYSIIDPQLRETQGPECLDPHHQ